MSHFPLGLDGNDRPSWPTVAGPSLMEDAEQLDKLASLIPRGGMFLEIGAWTAATAAYIADKRKDCTVVTADVFRNAPCGMLAYANYLPRKNLRLWFGGAEELMRMASPGTFDVALIDGAHDYGTVFHDLRLASVVVGGSGVIAAHDFSDDMPEVVNAIDRFLVEHDLRIEERIGRLIIIRANLPRYSL